VMVTVAKADTTALRNQLDRNTSTHSCARSVTSMTILGLILAVLAFLLAWPIPAALARFRGDPISEVVLWQAVGLSGGLSLIGAALAFAVAPGSTSLPQGILALLRGQTHTQLSAARLCRSDLLLGAHDPSALRRDPPPAQRALPPLPRHSYHHLRRGRRLLPAHRAEEGHRRALDRARPCPRREGADCGHRS